MIKLGFHCLFFLYHFCLPPTLLADSPEKEYLKAFQLSLDGSTHEAIDAYRKTLKQKPGWAEAHHNLGLLYYEVKMGVRALDHFRKAEHYYSKRLDLKAKTNLAIIQKNLQKAYKKLDIDPQDFGAMPTFSTKPDWHETARGFLIRSSGYVFTSWQAVKQANLLRVRFTDGRTLEAKLSRKFIVYNIALLKIDDSSQTPSTVLDFGNSSILKKEEDVFVPDLKTKNKTEVFPKKGKIRAINALEDNNNFFQIDIPLPEKQNGFPLFNSRGGVIGMLFSKSFMEKSYIQTKDLSENSSFAIKSNYLKRILKNASNTTSPTVENKYKILIDDFSAFSLEAQMNLVAIEITL